MPQVDTADGGIIGVQADQKPVFKQLPDRVNGVVIHRSDVHIGCNADFQSNTVFPQVIDQRRILQRAYAVPDPCGAEFAYRGPDTFRTTHLSRVDGNLEAGIPGSPEMFTKQIS